jgi:CRISPR-associated protein Cmr6
VHPQQGWQVGDRDVRKVGALSQISLYKPTLRFGISSSNPDVDWDEVWGIWEKAIATGLGSRVCAGYGHVEMQAESIMNAGPKVLYETCLRGQGQASKLLDDVTGEFRPNIFRAGLRGHALRIFSGLTDGKTATRLVEELFGGVSGHGVVGMVGMRFHESSLILPIFQEGSPYEQVEYKVEGKLSLLLARPLDDGSQEKVLKQLLAKLVQFSMVLGGFGKSWRRSDHRLFFDEYYKEGRYKALIGCHWQWVGEVPMRSDSQVQRVDKLGPFIDQVRSTAEDWMRLRGVTPSPTRSANWREAWHPQRVQVWGRLVGEQDASEAILWFHGPYQPRIGSTKEGSIYKSQSASLTGKVGQVGRLWHRMYPRVKIVKNPDPNGKPIPRGTEEYLELLTIFPDASPECKGLLEFLASKPFGFERLWGGA